MQCWCVHTVIATERTKTVGLVSGGVATVASHVGSGVGSVFRALGSLGSNVGSISSTTLAVLGRTVPKTQAQAPSVSPHLKCLLEVCVLRDTKASHICRTYPVKNQHLECVDCRLANEFLESMERMLHLH